MLKGPHPAFDKFKKISIEPQSLNVWFIWILSALGHWCEFLTNVEYFPAIVFPFVKSIENDDLIIFEIVVSLVMHWFKTWFMNFP